ncbi:MAG: hypothetical protein ACRCUY_03325, partial [Thermoguttaceae bacterium]
DAANDNADGNTAPILLASASEEIVPAAPLSSLNEEVTQTGIFCQKPAKPPAAWSFSSPLFKAASVPMGWGAPGFNGYINQMGTRGCSSQVGFGPGMGQMGGDMSGGPMGQMGMGGGMPPMNTFQMGQMGGGPQIQPLPNGMLMVTMPADHANCGIFRCRCGNTPRVMFLPGAPTGMPGMMPGGPADSSMMPFGYGGGMNVMSPQMMSPQMMMPQMMSPQMAQQQMMQAQMMQMAQPQVMPVTMMSPMGPVVVGYRAIQNSPNYQNGMSMSGMGFGMHPMMQAQFFAQQQAQQQMQMQWQMQQQMMQQLNASQQNGLAGMSVSTNSSDGKEGDSQELQAPQSIASGQMNGFGNQFPNSFGNAFMMPGMMGMDAIYANPYSLYAQQAGAPGTVQGQPGQSGQPMMPQNVATNPMMNGMPAGMQGTMTPFGVMAFYPNGQMGMMNAGMMPGMGMMNAGMMPGMGMMNAGMMPGMGMMGGDMMGMGMGMNGGNGMMGGGMSMSDMMQMQMMMMLMNNNNNQKRTRFRLFERLAERRESRRGGQSGNNNDFLQQMMMMWATPYSAPETAMRMPARNAYPYGYFGAQPSPMQTANYGGNYNLYMGNTSYPGFSGLY